MKRLKTLALAGIVAISACTTTHNALDGSEQSPSDTLYLLEAGTDTMYTHMTDERLERRLDAKEGISDRVDDDVRESFVRRYYGLDALSRSMYLTEDLLKAKQRIKDLQKRQTLSRGERKQYETRIDDLQGQIRYLRDRLDDKPEVIYKTRIIERSPATREHPVEKDVPFIRLGDEYYQFPFARIVCPGLNAPVKACIDLMDVRRDYQQHIREQGAESLRKQ